MTEADPRELVFERDGRRIAVLDWGSNDDAEPLLLLHPTGFCAGVFHPLATRLRDRYRPIGIDTRAHGGSDPPTESPDGFAFALLADDVVEVLEQLGIDQLVALGESLGGGVASLVDAARPRTIRRLMLCEGIAFGGELLPERRGAQPGGDNYMATIARKRTAVWPDRRTVRESYGSRQPLSALAFEALDAYVRWGFVDRPDGTVELACAPEDEATQFEMALDPRSSSAAWEHLPDLSCRTTVLHGDDSNLPAHWFAAQAERADAPLVTVPGTHFFLQEDTARAEALVREHLGS